MLMPKCCNASRQPKRSECDMRCTNLESTLLTEAAKQVQHLRKKNPSSSPRCGSLLGIMLELAGINLLAVASKLAAAAFALNVDFWLDMRKQNFCEK